jgi:hypothetical protein
VCFVNWFHIKSLFFNKETQFRMIWQCCTEKPCSIDIE